jgi:N-acetylneuraminic acid mutarotase
LGALNGLGPVFDGGERYLGISVDGAPELTPRQAVGSVAYSLKSRMAEQARDADLLDGIDSTKFMRVDQNSGTAGDFLVGGSMLINELLAVGGGLEGYDTISIVASPARFPTGDDTANEIAEGGARLAIPMIYRSSRTPGDGSGDAPFDRAGELVLQGTSHGRNYNRGISLVTGPQDGAPAVRLRVMDTGRVGIGVDDPRATLEVAGIDSDRAVHPSLGVRIGAPNSGIHIYSGTPDDMASIVLQSHNSPDRGVRMRTHAQEGGLIVEGYNGGTGDLTVRGAVHATSVMVAGVTVINEEGQLEDGVGGGAGLPAGALVLVPPDCDDCQDNLEEAGFILSEYTLRGNGPTSYDFDRGSWARVANMPRSKLWSSGGSADGKFYALGGHSSDANVEEYDLQNNSWRTRSNMPTGRYAFACAGLVHSDGREYLHCVGGSGSGGYKNVNERFDPRNNSWTTNWARLGTPAYCVQGAVYENEFYVFGGFDGNYYPWVQIYNPINDTWRRGRDMPVGRAEHNVGLADGKFYVVAGTGPGLSRPSSRVDVYDPEANSWSRAPDIPWRASQPGVVGVGPRLLVFGGTGAGAGTSCSPCYRRMTEFNPATNSWLDRADMPATRSGGRAFASVGLVGNVIVQSGGEPWHITADTYTIPGDGVGTVRFQAWQVPGINAE